MKNPVFTGAGVAIITPMYEDGRSLPPSSIRWML